MGARGRGAGQGNYTGGSNPFFLHQNYDESNNRGWTHGTSSGNRGERGKSVDDRGRGGRGRGRGRGGRGSRGGYNQARGYDRQHHGNFDRNQVEHDMNDDSNEDGNAGFRKFRDPSRTAEKGNEYDRQQNHNSNRYNTAHSWNRNNRGSYKAGEGPSRAVSNLQSESLPEKSKRLSQSSEVPPSEPKLVHKIKTEKIQQENSSPESDNVKSRKPPPDSSSSSDSSSEEEETPPAKTKPKEKQLPVQKIKIKKEQLTLTTPKKKVISDPPPAPPTAQPSLPTESSSSGSSSESSSSGEDEIPKMPHPIKSSEAVKPKKERTSEDDVVCLGKMNNIENLVDKDESGGAVPCMVCKKHGHSALECQMECKKCSHSSYECQTVCKNCGEIYSQSVHTLTKPPNPFVMFMQFMQFCMSQYYNSSTDMKIPFPQFNVPNPVRETASPSEVSRKDIEMSKKKRKRTKSESKHSRKKSRKNSETMSEEESDSSSKATSSIKKRKKHAKNVAREKEISQTTPHQEHHVPSPFGQFHTSTPFVGAFNPPGYNPMLAFNHMMGYNPPAMNFQR